MWLSSHMPTSFIKPGDGGQGERSGSLVTTIRLGVAFIGIAAATVGWAQQYTISVYAGTQSYVAPPPGAFYSSLRAIAVDQAGRLYFGAGEPGPTPCYVFRLDLSGAFTCVAGADLADPSKHGAVVASLAVDGADNVYVFDNFAGRIRKVSPTGVITTAAGNGVYGYSGDGQPAVSAQIAAGQIAVDNSGNLYIAGGNRVRKVTADGIIRTVAGTGTSGYSGDGAAAVSALIDATCIAVDNSGNIYVAGGARIRKVTPDGIIHTVAGSGTYGDAGDGGPAADALLGFVTGLALDIAGNLYILDVGNGRIRKMSPDGMIGAVAGPAPFDDDRPVIGLYPSGLAIDGSGNLYIVNYRSQRIHKVAPGGANSTVVTGTYLGDGGPATSALLNIPISLALDGAGNLYIADYAHFRVRKVSTDGIIGTVAVGTGFPSNDLDLGDPVSVATDSSGALFILEGEYLDDDDSPHAPIWKISPDGVMSRLADTGSVCVGGVESVYYDIAGSLAMDSGGNLYALYGRCVQTISPDGTIIRVAGAGDPNGDSGDGGPALNASLAGTGFAIDQAGNLYVVERANQRVRKISTDGIITTVAGTGIWGFSGDGGPAVNAQLAYPEGVAVDGSGNLYIADTDNNRIRKVSTDGTISTVAGSGKSGVPGDGELLQPGQIAVDSTGRKIYFTQYEPYMVYLLQFTD